MSTAPPLPYEGAVWIQGHYDWGGDGWVWLPGTYVRPRAGHQWVSPRYERDGGRVRYVPGYWMPEQSGMTVEFMIDKYCRLNFVVVLSTLMLKDWGGLS